MSTFKQSILFVAGLVIGGSLCFTGLIATPTVCRQVVLKDLKEAGAYTQALAQVMPASDAAGSDFVTALTRGRK